MFLFAGVHGIEKERNSTHKPHHMPEQSTACAPFACLQAQVSALQSKLAAVEANGGGEGSKLASSAAHHETITQLEKQVRVSWSKKEKRKTQVCP